MSKKYSKNGINGKKNELMLKKITKENENAKMEEK
jgi:hypothetical protein